jgi:hypothetical protein
MNFAHEQQALRPYQASESLIVKAVAGGLPDPEAEAKTLLAVSAGALASTGIVTFYLGYRLSGDPRRWI